jgi:hypothetical protein
VRARTEKGATGWIDSDLLLTQGQMDDIHALEQAAEAIPSQGRGTVYANLNVHASASRTAPNLLQLQEGDEFDVVGHSVTPRESATRVKAVVIAKAAEEQESKREPEPGLVTGPTDDWFLIRTDHRQVGWVLMRAVQMKIPEDVALYADRQVVTSYHPFDGDRWLWTTVAKSGQAYDFDSIRFFAYNARRERYEVALTERGLKGFLPVEISSGTQGDQFSLVVEDKDGQIVKRTYSAKGSRIRLVSKAPAKRPAPLPDVRSAKAFDAAATDDDGFFRSLAKKWFGQ